MMRASSFGSQVMISGPDSRPRVSGSELWMSFLKYFPVSTFNLQISLNSLLVEWLIK
jgi:hypothetical protein